MGFFYSIEVLIGDKCDLRTLIGFYQWQPIQNLREDKGVKNNEIAVVNDAVEQTQYIASNSMDVL